MDTATLQQLCRPEAFPHPAVDIDLRETHISWVILSGEYAYKIKKPLDLGFLDFSTLALRRHFCEEELRLNRRFSPELYLDVLPITGDASGPRLDGDGPVIDYAVKMRRFDEDQLLDNVAARGELDERLIRALGRELARLHGELPRCHPDPEGTGAGTPAALEKALEQNFRQIREYPLGATESRQLEAVEKWTRERYAALLPTMKLRVVNGWVIDGHGDDHLGNIALIDGQVRLFDCIEFNADFRIIDSIGEIALLTMDLDARDHPAESHRLLTDYLEYRGDYDGLILLDLYRSYYAMVRAKVNLLREPRDHPDLVATDAYQELCRYLELARSYCRPPRNYLAITHGVSGSGKSTVAGKLVAASGAVRIRSDVERKRLFGLAPEERSRPEDEASLYSPDMTRRTFTRLEELAALIITAGFPVIVDATFLHRAVRGAFQELADRLHVPYVILDCVASPDALRERLAARDRHRQDASEAGIAIMERQLAQREPLSGEELCSRVEMDSGEDAGNLWQRVEELTH